MLSSSDGSVVGSRYKSSVACNFANSSIVLGIYFAAAIEGTSNKMLMLYNTITTAFSFYQFTGTLYRLEKSPENSRMIMLGKYSSKVYISKAFPESIAMHPDFTSTTIYMNAQSSGSFDVSSDSNYVLGAVTSRSITSISFMNQTVTYQSNTASSYTSDVLFMVSSLSYMSLTENLYLEIIADLTCSSSGSTSISYSLSDYYGSSLPSWISFDSTNGVLKITIPSYSSTTYLFSIDSTVSGVSSSIPKLVYLKSNKCSSSH